MLRWILGWVVKRTLTEFEPVVQDEVNTLFLDVIAMVQGSKSPHQLMEDLASHFTLFKKANA